MVMAKGPLRPVPVSHASPKAVERVLETLDSAGASDSAETRETRLDDVTPAPATKEQENKGLRTIAAAAAAPPCRCRGRLRRFHRPLRPWLRSLPRGFSSSRHPSSCSSRRRPRPRTSTRIGLSTCSPR